MASKPTRLKPVKDEVLKFESPGQTAEGFLQGAQDREFEDRKTKFYTLIDENEQPVSFYGSVVLDNHLARVPIGEWVQITYKGQAGKGSRRYKDFDINVGVDTDLLPPARVAQGD